MTFVTNQILTAAELNALAAQAASLSINLAAEGIICDGVTDQTAAINALFTTYGTRVYRLSYSGTGQVLATGKLNVPSGAWLELADDVTLTVGQISFTGTVGSEVNLTVAAAKGDATISTTTTGFAVDDWLLIKGCINLFSTDAGVEQLGWDSSTTGIYAGEFVRLGVVATGLVTIWGTLRFPYTLTGGASTQVRTTSTVRKVTWSEGGGVRGGTIIPYGTSYNDLILATYARNVGVVNVTFRIGAARYSCFTGRWTQDCYAEGNRIYRDPFTTVVSGLSLRNSFHLFASVGWTGRNNIVDGGAQAFDCDYAAQDIPHFGHSWSGNTIRNALDGGTSHNGGRQIRINNNTVENCLRIARIRTPDSTANGNKGVGDPSTAAGIYLMGGFIDGSQAVGNEIQGYNYGVQVEWTSAGGNVIGGTALVAENTLRGTQFGVHIAASSSQLGTLRRATLVRENTIISPTENGVWVDSYANGTEIADNVFTGTYTQSPIRLPSNVANIRVGRNTHHGIGAVTAIIGPGSTALTDTVTWPSGDASASWTIAGQTMSGTNGGERSSMPSLAAAYASVSDVGTRAVQGALTVVDSGAVTLGGFGTAGGLTGSKAALFAAAAAAASFSTAQIIALNLLLDASNQIANTASLFSSTDGLNAVTNNYRKASTDYLLLTSLSGFTLTRATAATDDTSGNVRTNFVSGEARLTDRGLGVFEAATNQIRNGDGIGTTLSGTNTGRPTNWQFSLATGLSYSIVAAGTYLGRSTYVDVQITGSPTGSSQTSTLGFESSTVIAAASGQTWTVACDIQLVGGALTNVSTPRLQLVERNSGGSSVLTNAGSSTTLDATLRRPVYTVALSNGATAFVSPQFAFTSGAAGAPVNFTVRLIHPQARQALLAVPYVATTGSATATANADVPVLAASSYTASSCSLFWSAELASTQPATQVLGQLDDGTDSNRIVCRRTTGAKIQVAIYASAVQQLAVTSVASFSGTQTVQVAATCTGGNLTVIINNGTPVVTALPGTMPTTLATMRCGTDVTGNALNGHLRAFLGFTTPVADVTMGAITV
jgi:hypothetical protein